MSYPINPNIPAANNDPADDQPGMQTNFANINSYVQVDHTNPSLGTGAGQHKQVTFQSNNPPSSPVSPPVLFTNTQDGAGNNLPGSPINPELFFYSGSSTVSQSQNICQSVGSIMLFGGIIIKWGGAAGVVDGQRINFVNPFPNALWSLQVSGGIHSGTQPTINFDQTTYSATGFNAKITGQQVINVLYIAIGN